MKLKSVNILAAVLISLKFCDGRTLLENQERPLVLHFFTPLSTVGGSSRPSEDRKPPPPSIGARLTKDTHASVNLVAISNLRNLTVSLETKRGSVATDGKLTSSTRPPKSADASVSVGLKGTGKLGKESGHSDPVDLDLDSEEVATENVTNAPTTLEDEIITTMGSNVDTTEITTQTAVENKNGTSPHCLNFNLKSEQNKTDSQTSDSVKNMKTPPCVEERTVFGEGTSRKNGVERR